VRTRPLALRDSNARAEQARGQGVPPDGPRVWRVPLSIVLPDELLERVAHAGAEIVFARLELSEPSPYLTVAEAAQYLRSKKQRVYDLLSAGRLTRFKDGSRVLVERAEIDAYLAGKGRRPVAPALPRKAKKPLHHRLCGMRWQLGIRWSPLPTAARGPSIGGDKSMPRRRANAPGPA